MISGVISQLLVEYLLEMMMVVFSLLLTVNIAAYKIVWNKVDNNENSIKKNSETMSRLMQNFYGMDEDPTDEGYIMENEERFDSIDEKLDRMCNNLDNIMLNQTAEHEYFRNQFGSLIEGLDDSDEINITESDVRVDFSRFEEETEV